MHSLHKLSKFEDSLLSVKVVIGRITEKLDKAFEFVSQSGRLAAAVRLPKAFRAFRNFRRELFKLLNYTYFYKVARNVFIESLIDTPYKRRF